MKNLNLTAMLTLAASISASAGSVAAAISPILPSSSTRQLVEHFVGAYARHDAAGLATTTTKDFTARVHVNPPLSDRTVTAGALARSWQQQSHTTPSAYPDSEPVAIYRTPKARTWFVAYRIMGQTGVHIALLELRGHLVARINDFPGSSESIISRKLNLAAASN